jgi:hypothetical protein
MKPGMYIMEAAYPMPSENIAGPFARANGERMRFRRMYAQTKGALRLHRFYSHFPHYARSNSPLSAARMSWSMPGERAMN